MNIKKHFCSITLLTILSFNTGHTNNQNDISIGLWTLFTITGGVEEDAVIFDGQFSQVITESGCWYSRLFYFSSPSTYEARKLRISYTEDTYMLLIEAGGYWLPFSSEPRNGIYTKFGVGIASIGLEIPIIEMDETKSGLNISFGGGYKTTFFDFITLSLGLGYNTFDAHLISPILEGEATEISKGGSGTEVDFWKIIPELSLGIQF